MSQTCVALGLGLAFVATLLLNLGSEAPSLPLWQKAAYFVSGGIGMVVVSRILAARAERAMRVTVRQCTHGTDR